MMKTSSVMVVQKLSTRRFTKKSKSGSRNRKKLTPKAIKSLLNQTNQAKATVRVKVRKILMKKERAVLVLVVKRARTKKTLKVRRLVLLLMIS